MKLFAVTGNPILFSRSPEIFNPVFKNKNIDAKYLRLSAKSAKEAIDLFKELGLSGISVTAPFKTDIMQYLDQIDEIAQNIGAVNTVVKQGDKLFGYNTDYNGIVNSLENIKDQKILLIGAGGAAQAVAYSITKNDGLLTIFNRTTEKAEALAKKYDAKICVNDNLQKATQEADIIINTLPSGIKVLEDDWFSKQQTIFDAIYHNSVYQDIATKTDISFLSGETWLKNQAIPAFKLFFKDENLSFDEIEFSDKKANDKLILTGFMGAGKSIIGEAISKKIDCNFFSTDTIIENKEGLSINEMFAKYGESYFRKTEQEVLNMLSSMNGKAIISSGGGMVLDSKNRELIAENYLSVWLYANSESIMQRAKPENRPLLKNNFNLGFIQDLMEQRKDFYAQSCNILINTNNRTPQEVIELLEQELASIY